MTALAGFNIIPRALLLSAGLTLLTLACGGGGGSTPPPAVAAAPAGLNYTIAAPEYIAGAPIVVNLPTSTGGTVTTYAVAPPLPEGLNFNTSTGAITGIPSAPVPATTYRITASNQAGSTTVDLVIKVTAPAPPTGLAYANVPSIYFVGQGITPVNPSHDGGPVAQYAVAPPLPPGFQFDAATGAITGTPSAAAPTATYRVTASNAGGSTGVDLTFTVNVPSGPPPAGLTYLVPAATYQVGTPIPANTPTLASGTAQRYAIHPPLPAGLNFHTDTGIIDGNPSVPASAVTYRVTAGNAGGSTGCDLTITVTAPSGPPPAGLTYPVPTATYLVGSTIPANTPTLASGTGVTYAIHPPLPAGLNLNTNTGIIDGNPSAPAPAATYRVTAGNAAGSTGFDLTITVAIPSGPPPVGLTYPVAAPTYLVGTPIPANTPTLASGTGVTYAIQPPLPAGLNFDTHTGIIDGNPSAPAPATTHRVTASNAGGSTGFDLTITVAVPSPAGLTYPVAAPIYLVGTPIPANAPTLASGTGVTYAIQPPLPAGLNFNSNTGIIDGNPSAPAPATTYRVTASNAGGSTGFDLTITVAVPSPAGLTYPVAAPTYQVGTPIPANTPTLASGTGVTYAIQPPLPAGLNFNINTGIIDGNPSAPAPATIHRVTASNAGGSTGFDLTITVHPVPPTLLAYPRLAPEYPVGLEIVPVTPVGTGGPVASYAVTPTLPLGLHLNTTTGAITGTPTARTFGNTYRITATNAGGSVTTRLWLSVTTAPVYGESESIYTAGVAMPGNAPIYGDKVTATWTITPGLPAGLHWDNATGAITGTPSAPAARTIHHVTATNAGGSNIIDLAITIHATRHDAFATPFAVVPGFNQPTFRWLDFPGVMRSRQYGLTFPKAPILHAYNPAEFAEIRIGDGKLLLATNLNLKFPSTFFEALPDSIRTRLTGLGFNPSQVDIFCVIQDAVWNPGVPILLRPHYWTDPEAPFKGSYDTAPAIEVGLFEAEAGVYFEGHAPTDFFPHVISVHPVDEEAFPDEAPLIRSSGPTLAIHGLDPANSTSFWSLTRYGTRAAATLHLWLNDAHHLALEGVSLHANNLTQLVQQLDLSALAGTRMVDQVKGLTRPIITHALATPGMGHVDLTLTGTCLTGATAATVGVPAGTLLAGGTDTTVTVRIPAAGTAGDPIVVTTPMGRSTGFPYP